MVRARQFEEAHQWRFGEYSSEGDRMLLTESPVPGTPSGGIQLNIQRRSICSASGTSAGEVQAWWEAQVFFSGECVDLGVTSTVVQLWEGEDLSDEVYLARTCKLTCL